MRLATTIEDAAYRSLNNHGDIWGPRGEWWDFYKVYLDRVREFGEVLSPGADLMRTSLIESVTPIKLMVAGQPGSGKSMELRRLAEDPEITRHFEVVRLLVLDKLNDAVDHDLSHLLLIVASVLADHIVERDFHQLGEWDGTASITPLLRRWVEQLSRDRDVALPTRFDALTLRLKSGLADATIRLRSEEEVRERISNLAVRDLQILCQTVIAWTEDVAQRPILLVVDDADKLHRSASVESIFIRGLRPLSDLPCRIVFTCPLALLFRLDLVRPPGVFVHRVFNVKVVHRESPERLLPGALAFFRELLARVVEPGSGVIDDDVVARAALLSGHPPRFSTPPAPRQHRGCASGVTRRHDARSRRGDRQPAANRARVPHTIRGRARRAHARAYDEKGRS